MVLKVAMLQTGYAAWPDKDVLDRDYRVRLKPPTLRDAGTGARNFLEFFTALVLAYGSCQMQRGDDDCNTRWSPRRHQREIWVEVWIRSVTQRQADINGAVELVPNRWPHRPYQVVEYGS